MRRIIFYHPHPLVENPRKGSELRPKKMKEAFETIGYQVDLVTGNSFQRKKSFKQIKENIQTGYEYDFMYAESLNIPILLADSHHLPLRPLQDYRFFKMLNRNFIPIGFFYRDLYWRGDFLKKRLSFLKYYTRKLFHWIEWYGIKKTVDWLFLPTKKMKIYLPVHKPQKKIDSLYPGCSAVENLGKCKQEFTHGDQKLNLFYVGGVKPPFYDLKPMLKIVSKQKNIKLRLCCREEEWSEYSEYYKEIDLSNVEILHANSNQIGEFYRKSDIFLDIRKPEGYLKTTIPTKIFESISYNLPLLLLEGTEYADFIKNEGGGWVAKDTMEVKKILNHLNSDRNEIINKKNEIQKIKKKHTWEERARKVKRVLTAQN